MKSFTEIRNYWYDVRRKLSKEISSRITNFKGLSGVDVELVKRYPDLNKLMINVTGFESSTPDSKDDKLVKRYVIDRFKDDFNVRVQRGSTEDLTLLLSEPQDVDDETVHEEEEGESEPSLKERKIAHLVARRKISNV